MENLNEYAIYRLDIDFEQQGELTGMFIAKKIDVKLLLENNLTIYFGEVLGKHSEIYTKIKRHHIKFITDDLIAVDIFRKYNLGIGFNPFEYQIIDDDREEINNLVCYEAIEILKKELCGN